MSLCDHENVRPRATHQGKTPSDEAAGGRAMAVATDVTQRDQVKRLITANGISQRANCGNSKAISRAAKKKACRASAP